MNSKKYNVWDYLGGALVLLVTCIMFTQVITRYVFKISLSFPDELARYLFVWLVMVSSIAAIIRGGHFELGITAALSERSRIKLIINTMVDFISVAFLVLVTYFGVILVLKVQNQLSPAMQISVSYYYAALPVGMTGMAIYMLIGAKQRLDHYFGKGGIGR